MGETPTGCYFFKIFLNNLLINIHDDDIYVRKKQFVLHVSERKKKISSYIRFLKISKISVSFLKVIYGSGSYPVHSRKKAFYEAFTSDDGLC